MFKDWEVTDFLTLKLPFGWKAGLGCGRTGIRFKVKGGLTEQMCTNLLGEL